MAEGEPSEEPDAGSVPGSMAGSTQLNAAQDEGVRSPSMSKTPGHSPPGTLQLPK